MWENEIILGNAYELIKQIPNKSIDLICTDPPYQIEGLHIGTGVLKDRIPSKCRTGVLSNNYVYQMMNGNLGNGIDKTILDEYVRVMKNINIYLWCNKEQLMTYLDYFVKGLDCNFEIFIWGKINPPRSRICTFSRTKNIAFISGKILQSNQNMIMQRLSMWGRLI